MAQMGLAMLGIELVRAFLLLSLAANLTHSFSLTPHPVVEVMNVTSM
jgi:hypothetical protein